VNKRFKGAILGLDVGGTKTAVVLGTTEGEILARRQFPTLKGFPAFFERLCPEIEHLLAGDQTNVPGLISVSIGGPLDIERGIIYSPPNLPQWDAVPLKARLEARFDLPTLVEHDGNAGALAERYFGAARGFDHVIFLTMGTGLGGGLILNGELYRGATDLAGEVGHIRIAPDGPKAYGKAGSWEGVCSGPGLVRIARWRYPDRWPATEPLDGRELTRLAHEKDADALKAIKEGGRWLGRGLAMLADILNPQVIVIGSMAVRLGELLLAPARDEMRREALPGTYEACRVVPSALGDQLGDIAALCAAIQGLEAGRVSL
jgi:glucokinase